MTAPDQLAAFAVVVAHLHRALETAARPRIGGPVERGCHVGDPVVGLVAEERAVVHAGGAHDLAGVHEPLGIEAVLHLLEQAHGLGAVHLLVELGAHQAVAVLARMRALVGLDHGEGLLGDGAHGVGVLLQLQVEHGAHVQAADASVRVPGALGAVLGEDGGEALGVVGQMLERHRAVLDEGDGLSLGLHRHHDVEAGGAHLPHRALAGRIRDLYDALGVAEVAHQLIEPIEAAQVLRLAVLGKLDEQQGVRRPTHVALHDGAEHGDVAGELDQRAVDHLDGDGAQLDDVLRRLHGLAETDEVADAQRLVFGDGRELQFQAARKGERAFRTAQQRGEVDRPRSRHQRVDQIAADTAGHLGEGVGDVLGLAAAEGEHVAEQLKSFSLPLRRRDAPPLLGGRIVRHFGEARLGAVGQDGVDRQHVVAHDAVADRARAAGIVAGHAADGGAARGGHVDREPQARQPQLPVEIVEHDAGLHHAGAVDLVDLDQLLEVLAEVHDQRAPDRLAGLRGAAAARQHGHALLARDRQRRAHVVVGARDHHAQRLDLVVRGVGGVAPAAEAIEQHLALQLAAQALGQSVGNWICFGRSIGRYCRFDAPRASRLALLRDPPRYAF